MSKHSLFFIIMAWGIIIPCQLFSAPPQIFSSNLASENYFQSPKITATIIVAHSTPITQITFNGIPQQFTPEETIVLEESLMLRKGENRLLVEARTQAGETSKKIFFLYYGTAEELENRKREHEEAFDTTVKTVDYLLDLRLQYDDNALFIPLNENLFRISQEGSSSQNTDKKTYELLTDFNVNYHPSVQWNWENIPVSPELSYRFQSQWNSTLKESGYLAHWLSGKLTWELGNHRIDTKYSYIFLRTNTAKAKWEGLAKLQVIEISGLQFHSQRFQTHPFLIFINQDFNDSLNSVSKSVGGNGGEVEDKGHDLDGVKRLLGYGLTYHLLESYQSINAILLHTTSDTRKDYDDYTAVGGILKYDYQLKSDPSRILIEGQYEKQNHQAVRFDLTEDSAEKKRSDVLIRLTLGIERPIDLNSHINAHLIKTKYDSTLSEFDYQRNVINVGVTLRF